MDLALQWDDRAMGGDLALALPDLATDDGLRTAVLMSIFLDREAAPDDRLPDDTVDVAGALVRRGSGDRRGWFGDWYAPARLDQLRAQGQLAAPPAPGSAAPPLDRIGSRLWLLAREKRTDDVLARARFYIAEALQWLVDDGVAAAVTVECEWDEAGRLVFSAAIARPLGAGIAFAYAYAWEAM